MKQYHDLLQRILLENVRDNVVDFDRETRSGATASIFGANLEFDMREGFPVVTTKRVPFKSVMGELLWFLNGEHTISDLKKRTELSEDAWTIWTPDCERWHSCDGDRYDFYSDEVLSEDDLGRVYGVQWRQWEDRDGDQHDQIAHLIGGIKNDPMSRYHIVNGWNVADIRNKTMALPPCHMMFQVFVTPDGYMDLMWYQRSCDAFLGLPFNIASYAALLTIIAKSTGYKPRFLKATIGDCHIYADHFNQVLELLERSPLPLPRLKLPQVVDKENFFEYTNHNASAYKLVGYESHPAIKAPLLVGAHDEKRDSRVVLRTKA